MNWKDKYDRMNIAIVSGLILPIIAFIGFKFYFAPGAPYSAYWYVFTSQMEIRRDIMVMSLLPDLLMFYFLFFQWKMDRAAKGMVLAVLFYGFIAMFTTMTFE